MSTGGPTGRRHGSDRGHQVRRRTPRWPCCWPRRRAATSCITSSRATCGCATASPRRASRPAERARRSRRLVQPRRAARSSRSGDFDVILMRKDPPFDTEYIYTTYILERAELAGALVVNRPQGLRDMNEKVYTAWFPQCCAPTLITRDMDDDGRLRPPARHDRLQAAARHGRALDLRARRRATRTRSVVFETLTDYGQRFAMVQRYLPEIVVSRRCARAAGRRRTARPTRWRASPRPTTTAATSPPAPRAWPRPLTSATAGSPREIGPALRAAGMLFVGLDVIGGYVTEINVTSPTGVRELQQPVRHRRAGAADGRDRPRRLAQRARR